MVPEPTLALIIVVNTRFPSRKMQLFLLIILTQSVFLSTLSVPDAFVLLAYSAAAESPDAVTSAVAAATSEAMTLALRFASCNALSIFDSFFFRKSFKNESYRNLAPLVCGSIAQRRKANLKA
uniref:Uncharacterized protein n=1 Tax=Ditylum brightwellii TaxID=49249 RepID=A0A7S4RQZ1_9STRA